MSESVELPTILEAILFSAGRSMTCLLYTSDAADE